MEQRVCFKGDSQRIGHSLQGADYSLQLRGKLQTARLAGHQPQANPFGLQTFNKRKNGSCPGPCVTTPSDCLRQTTSVFSKGTTGQYTTRTNRKKVRILHKGPTLNASQGSLFDAAFSLELREH